MKIFAIKNPDLGKDVDLGYFFYYDKLDDCYIELNDTLDAWDFPFILDSFAKQNRWVVNQKYTRLFISQRIIPSDRQNIGMILKDNGLEVYDEIQLFLLADGRCAQDECYIKQIPFEQLPLNIRKRRKRMIVSAKNISAGRYLVGFVDNKIGLWEADRCAFISRQVRRLLTYKNRLSALQAVSSGFELRWDEDAAGISYDAVYENCEFLPVDMESLERFTIGNLVTTQDIINEMGCTRQNINDHVKRGRIRSVDLNAKTQIFSRREYQKLL